MTDKTQPTAHAEITAPISADLRGIDDAGAQPDVLRKPNRECFDAFMKAAEDAGVTHMQQWVEVSGYQCADCKTPLKQGYDCGACGSFEAEEVPDLSLQAAPPAPAAVAVPAPIAAGMKAAADLVQEQADLYIAEHAETDPDTGAVIWHHRDYGFDWHNGLEELAQKLLARAALAAAPAQAVAVPAEVELPDVEDMAHSAVQEALSYGVSHDVFHRWMRAVMDKTVQALAAAPAQEHATQLAGQGQTFAQWWDEQRKTAAERAPGDDWMDLSAEDRDQYEAVFHAGAKSAAPAQAQEDARDADGDKALLDFLRDTCCDLRSIDVPN
ncbi:MAG: hypothetical protein RR720_03290 [Comamonas sp.]|uniref:hypothetical protein n=1 Tax=Comamonas sp. TaxID=34028 RepID=UPI002FC90397